jgi:hypothetical protein
MFGTSLPNIIYLFFKMRFGNFKFSFPEFQQLGNLSMKEGSLFCSYEIHQTRMLQIMFLVSLESSQGGGVHGLSSMTFGLVVQKFLNIE